jgi:hypothetical protein
MVGLDVEGCGGEMRGREEKEKVLTGFMIAVKYAFPENTKPRRSKARKATTTLLVVSSQIWAVQEHLPRFFGLASTRPLANDVVSAPRDPRMSLSNNRAQGFKEQRRINCL